MTELKQTESTVPEEKRTVVGDGILVLGMHRSGTSALMGALSLIGVRLGEPLMAAQAANPRGFFEHLHFYDLHQQILDRFGHVWDDLRSFDIERLDAALVDKSVEEIEGLVRRHFGDGRLWSVKDPRMCRLQALWSMALERLGSSPRYVLAFRHPQEVTASLSRRDGFSRDKAEILWADHMLTAERASRGAKRAFVNYDSLLNDPLGTLERIAEQLGCLWPRKPAAARAEIETFLERGLKHHAASPQITTQGLLGDVVPRIYRAVSAAENAPGSLDIEDLNRCHDSLARKVESFEQVILEQATQLHIRERQTLLHQSEERAQSLLATVEHQQADINRLRSLVLSLENQLAERTEWLRVQDDLLHELKERVTSLEPRLETPNHGNKRRENRSRGNLSLGGPKPGKSRLEEVEGIRR